MTAFGMGSRFVQPPAARVRTGTPWRAAPNATMFRARSMVPTVIGARQPDAADAMINEIVAELDRRPAGVWRQPPSRQWRWMNSLLLALPFVLLGAGCSIFHSSSSSYFAQYSKGCSEGIPVSLNETARKFRTQLCPDGSKPNVEIHKKSCSTGGFRWGVSRRCASSSTRFTWGVSRPRVVPPPPPPPSKKAPPPPADTRPRPRPDDDDEMVF
jgi:hypothetical protein